MSDAHVMIPPVDKDIRIGSVFNHIFNVMYQTELTEVGVNKGVIWDFSQCQFLHPFFVGAMSVLKRQYKEFVKIKGLNSKISSYLEKVCFDKSLEISEREGSDDLTFYYDKTYVPICRFFPGDNSSLRAQEIVQSIIKQQLGYNNAINSVLSLLFAELIDNITEHSMSKEGFLFCQYMPSERMLYVMICDTGRSVYSSYAVDSRYSSSLTNLESSGLILALEGRSTKDRPENENRGYGISKSRKLVIEGLGGEFFILSGSAFARQDEHGQYVADLPADLRWNGTSILLKIPAAVPEKFSIYDYIS